MNYRHAFHAGNFADVHKHVALIAILDLLKRKETSFAVIDTHAGRGIYDLTAQETARTGEAAGGIGKLARYEAQTPVLDRYLEIVRMFRPEKYPGSPSIAASSLRPRDRLIAIESEAEESQRLSTALAAYRNARSVHADGYSMLSSQLPPPERRGVVFIDPPYEDLSEMQKIATAICDAYRRFATGTYVIWFPLKSAAAAEALAGELKATGIGKLLLLMLDVGNSQQDAPERLSASGLLVVNPPYGFDVAMRAAQAELLPLLARSDTAKARVEWLIGGP